MSIRNAVPVAVLAAILAAGAGQAHAPVQQTQTRTTWSGVYSAAQAARGEAAYPEHCSSCHGTDLSGGGFAPALNGTTFNSAWNDLTLDDLLDRIRTTMPQDKPGTLSRAVSADIVTFILQKGGFPAGETELAPQQENLKQIAFKATKP